MKHTCAGAVLASLLLAGCSSIDISAEKLWPFGSKMRERAQIPANAAEYRCKDSKRFFVRNLADGAAWLILPDRELRLEKTGEANRYAGSTVTLDIAEGTASVKDGTTSFANCAAAVATN